MDRQPLNIGMSRRENRRASGCAGEGRRYTLILSAIPFRKSPSRSSAARDSPSEKAVVILLPGRESVVPDRSAAALRALG